MPRMPPPGEHHEWLQQLVGTWTVESEMSMGDQAFHCTGTDTVRSLGGRWVIGELKTEFPGAGPMHAVMTLGYNPETGKYQGTWVDSGTDLLWIYEGTIDRTGKILTLEAEGPNMMDPTGPRVMFRDVIEFKSANHRTLSSYAQMEGEWVQFGTANYHRAEWFAADNLRCRTRRARRRRGGRGEMRGAAPWAASGVTSPRRRTGGNR